MGITVLEGTWEEVVKHGSVLAGRRVRVTVEESPQSELAESDARRSCLGPEERIRLLDTVLAMNKRVPPVGGNTFDREHVYAEEA